MQGSSNISYMGILLDTNMKRSDDDKSCARPKLYSIVSSHNMRVYRHALIVVFWALSLLSSVTHALLVTFKKFWHIYRRIALLLFVGFTRFVTLTDTLEH